MTDRKLMQRAMDALDRSDYLGWQSNIPIIKALRERLAQPESEPVAWMWADGTVTVDPDRADGTWTPLYTEPRQWQGLTDEEIKRCYFGSRADFMDYARAIEAKLKEKNT